MTWQYADLRALDPSDTDEPAQDLIAVYARQTQQNIEIRLDLLDFDTDIKHDIYIALDYGQGGATWLPVDEQTLLRWDILFIVPASGNLAALLPDGQSASKSGLSIWRDPQLDTITVRTRRPAPLNNFPAYQAQIFTASPGSTNVSDASSVINLAASPPPPARLLLAFWDVFPAYTPSNAQRRWDGAHTGPQSARHGLTHLLTAVQSTRLPIVLLDLKNPTSLTALEYTGSISQIRDLTKQGLLTIPDVLPIYIPSVGEPAAFLPPNWAYERALQDSRQAGKAFSLPTSQISYQPTTYPTIQPGYRLVFTQQPAITPTLAVTLQDTSLSDQTTLLVLNTGTQDTFSPELTTYQATSSGPSLSLRRLLVQGATSPEQPIIHLGGSLAASNWGEPTAASTTFTYIAAHPWMQVLDQSALLSLTSQEAMPAPIQPVISPYIPYTLSGHPYPSQENTAQINTSLTKRMYNLPPGPINDLAWQAYLSLLGPGSAQRHVLRATYLGQIGHLLAAADWAHSHQPLTTCSIDLDYDGESECILASTTFFAIIEPTGAYIPFAFSQNLSGAHQIIAPSSEFYVGLSDPMFWDIQRGVAADPNHIPGAFYTASTSNIAFTPLVASGEITFESLDGVLIKTYTLNQDTLSISFHAPGHHSMRSSFGLDPWLRFEPGWVNRYSGTAIQQTWTLQHTGGAGLMLHSTAPLRAYSFTDSHPLAGQPEDPNFSYPPGHYLLFPLSIVEIESPQPFTITLSGIK